MSPARTALAASSCEFRWLAACGLLLGLGAGLLWAGGVLARALDEAHDIFDEGSTTAHGVPLILPDPETYDAPEWMT